MITIICIYNNRETLNTWLISSLCSQNISYENIFIDNTDNKFISAADALNSTITAANGDYILFTHQDIKFETNNWLEKAEYYLKDLHNAGVCGVAGMSETGKIQRERGRNSIKWGVPPVVWDWSNPINIPTEVQTVDEMLFFVPRKLFSVLEFDKDVCDHWHLYSVDLCLMAKKLGFVNYVLPLSVWHKGTQTRISGILRTLMNFGHLPKEYYSTLKKVLHKYRKEYKWIYTTCGAWNAKQPVFLQRAGLLFIEGISIVKNTIKGNMYARKFTKIILQRQN